MAEQDLIGSSRRRIVIAGCAGNILEWYDFSIYGFFAPAIGEAFFPSHNPGTSLIDAYGVFAAGFLARPLGAFVFGYIGDHYGRRRALTLSVLAMAVPTVLMGLLPGYSQIGMAAAVLVVLLRLIQGLSVGGEYTTSVVFMIEHADPGRRGRIGAFGACGAFAGVMLGSAAGTLLALLMPLPALMAWGWRLPFLGGIAIGLVGYFLRRELAQEAPVEHATPPPLLEVVRSRWPAILQITGLKIVGAVGFYMMFVYVTTYLTQVVGLEKGHALAINTLGMAVALVALPFAGSLSDRIGRKPVLTLAIVAMAFLAFPLFRLLWHPLVHFPIIGQVGFALIIGLFEGVTPAVAAEAFPRDMRCTGVAISHNLCMALLGGTTPMVAAYLIERTQNRMAPPIYLIAAAVLSGLFLISLKETAGTPLSD